MVVHLSCKACACHGGSTNPTGGHIGKEQQAASVGILLQIMMLMLSFVLGHVLGRRRFYYLPEAIASLIIGLTVGGLANLSNTETGVRIWFNFHEEFFFLFLLPPIIFQSGFSLAPVVLLVVFSFLWSREYSFK